MKSAARRASIQLCLFVFRLNIQVNNFLVMSGRIIHAVLMPLLSVNIFLINLTDRLQIDWIILTKIIICVNRF